LAESTIVQAVAVGARDTLEETAGGMCRNGGTGCVLELQLVYTGNTTVYLLTAVGIHREHYSIPFERYINYP
jgi:hypothetical protein